MKTYAVNRRASARKQGIHSKVKLPANCRYRARKSMLKKAARKKSILAIDSMLLAEDQKTKLSHLNSKTPFDYESTVSLVEKFGE